VDIRAADKHADKRYGKAMDKVVQAIYNDSQFFNTVSEVALAMDAHLGSLKTVFDLKADTILEPEEED